MAVNFLLTLTGFKLLNSIGVLFIVVHCKLQLNVDQ